MDQQTRWAITLGFTIIGIGYVLAILAAQR